MSALTLKNIIVRNREQVGEEVAVALRNAIMANIDIEERVARDLGLVLGVLVERRREVDYQILEYLGKRVEMGSKVALEVLGRVIDDLKGAGENNNVWDSLKFNKYLEHLLTVLFSLCATPLKPQALCCLNLLVPKQPACLMPHLPAYIKLLLSSLPAPETSLPAI